ncbi:MAG: ribonuclease HII [Actinobacteria bacterium]|nr:ribonuclease HII [Actinomycetota bacterium]
MSSKTSQLPSLDFERTFLSRGVRYIIGMDEVGRGCIAGDVAVGAALIDLASPVNWPTNLKDSKLLSEKAREAIYPDVLEYVQDFAVGFGTVTEIEQKGIMSALTSAAVRALEKLMAKPETLAILRDSQVQIILDGNLDYLGAKSFGFPVVAKVKADQSCVSVAAASILAKVTRDRIMVDLHEQYPDFDLANNKGYASAKHRDSLRKLGASPVHRISWLTKIMKE